MPGQTLTAPAAASLARLSGLAGLAAAHGLHDTAASGTFVWLWALLLLPLAGAAVLLLGGSRMDRRGHLIGTGASGASFVVAIVLVLALISHHGAGRAEDLHLYTWIPVGGFHISVGLLFDPLSATFALLITGVGTLIHIYSIGYLAEDPGRRRFFAYMNLFLAAMLLLVLADNFLVLYVGWEGVGLCSYLLIAFWSYKPAAATAAKKAFIVNRVGDVGLSLAVMLMFFEFGQTSFAGVFAGAGSYLHAHSGVATALALLLLLAACGKSAQFPLHVWLPDAMEGPTPASALIHAATMVTAGVYLIARSYPIFDVSPDARLIVASVGVATILIGAIIGCANDDIKKVLAYSTISQIGYMFLGVGLGPIGYALAMLQLLAHGIFKAGLFMGAGSVMHATGDSTDMRHFGGLRRWMPVTFIAMTSCYLAIIGFPPFAAFFTKDKIIEAAINLGGDAGPALGVLAIIGAVLTAFYMTRLMAMTFLGKPRFDPDVVHPHEPSWVMTVPLAILALGAFVGGYLLTLGNGVVHWLDPAVGGIATQPARVLPSDLISLITGLGVLAGILLAGWLFWVRQAPAEVPVGVSPVVRAARDKLYVDALYESVLMRPGQYLSRALLYLDARGVDGVVNGLAAAVGGASGRLRRLQTGFVRSYALTMFAGLALVVAGLLLVRLG